MALLWTGLVMFACVAVPVPRTQAEMCTNTGSQPTAVRKMGKYGGSLEITAEVSGAQVFLSAWDRKIPDQDNNLVDKRVVIYADGRNQWPDSDTTRTYEATFTSEANKASYSLLFQKLTCYDRGEYQCTFSTLVGSCVSKFIVNITADPLPPVMKNDSIRGDVGSTVNVLCEANVGYPAGDIWWYYYPADGANAYRLTTDSPNLSSAGDCRFYARSTLTMKLKADDHDATIRCTPKANNGAVKDFVEAKVVINGFETTTDPTPKPCVGSSCSSTGAGVETRVRVWPCGLALFLMISHGFRIHVLA